LIRDSYFEDYAQELADDLGLLQKGSTWPYTCIDWEQAARELQMDYSMVTFDGVDYWVRS
jgi:antirestriction protein